jgi:ammonia channel protein AmtB
MRQTLTKPGSSVQRSNCVAQSSCCGYIVRLFSCCRAALQLCAGAIRSKNTMNILLQTILDAAVSAICWYLVG